MQDRNKFLELLREVVELARINSKEMTEEEIKDYFNAMDLSEDQLQYIYKYLAKTLNEEVQEGQEVLHEEEQVESNEDSAYLRMYRKELKDITPLMKDEKEELFLKLLSGNSSVKKRLVEGSLKDVMKFASRFKGKGVLQSELIQEGNLALLSAVDRLCTDTEIREEMSESTDVLKECEKFLEKEINNSLLIYMDMEINISDFKNTVLAKASLIYEAMKHLAKKLERVASIHELSEYTRISEQEILDIIELSEDDVLIGECDHYHEEEQHEG